MSIQFTSFEITQYHVKFEVNGKDISITLTKNYSSWEFKILEGITLNVKELIELCNLIYSEKVIDESDSIVIHFKNCAPTYVRGKGEVTTAIIGAVNITLSDK